MEVKNLIKQEYFIKAPIDEVWKALTAPDYIEAWGGGPVIISDKVGQKFSFWGGDIFGKNIEVDKPHKLVQEWYGAKDWEKPSIVTFLLKEKNDGTDLVLLHSDFPENERDDFDDGWKNYFLGSLKKYLENKV